MILSCCRFVKIAYALKSVIYVSKFCSTVYHTDCFPRVDLGAIELTETRTTGQIVEVESKAQDGSSTIELDHHATLPGNVNL